MNGDPELRALYQQVILEHNRRPRNFRAIDGGQQAEGHNPLCGDRLTVYVRIDNGVIVDVAFHGSACAIAKASASLMTEHVTGRTVVEAGKRRERFEQMIAARPGQPVDDLGTLTPLAAVRQFPMRVKCAALAWQALQAALQQRDGTAHDGGV